MLCIKTQGSQYWRTSGTSVDDGYPLSISEYWPGLPNDIDAAVVWARNGKAYFFKGKVATFSSLFSDTYDVCTDDCSSLKRCSSKMS